MDAVVFFSVAVLISSILLSRTLHEYRDEITAPEFEAAYDASSFLEVLLRGSIGESMGLDTTALITIRPTTTVGECLAMEAAALLDGELPDAFQEMNDMILDIAARIAGQLVVPHLWIMQSLNGSWVSVAGIEDRPPVSQNRHAASFDLPADGADRCRVTLVLEPALLPELLGI